MWVFTIPIKNKKGLTIYRQVIVHDKNSFGNLSEILFQTNIDGITVYEKEKDKDDGEV